MNKTLRRGTKACAAALDAAERQGEVKSYSLDNGYCARLVKIPNENGWTPRRDMERFRHAKLTTDGESYTLHFAGDWRTPAMSLSRCPGIGACPRWSVDR